MNHPVQHVFYTDEDIDDHEIFAEALRQVKPGATLHSSFISVMR